MLLSFQNKTFILDKYTWREGINNDNPKSIKTYLFISSVFSLANSGWIPISRDSSLELVRTKIWKSGKISQILRFDQSLFVLVMTTARLEKGMQFLNNVWDWSLLLVFRQRYQNLKQKNYRSSSVLISWSIRAAKGGQIFWQIFPSKGFIVLLYSMLEFLSLWVTRHFHGNRESC